MFTAIQKSKQKPFKGQGYNYHIHLFRLDESLLFIGVFGLIFAMSIFYLVEINKITSISYEIKEYEKQLSSVKKENQNLKVDIAASGSIYKLDNDISSLGMAAIEDAAYMKVHARQTAKR